MRRILEEATGLATGSNGTIHSGTTLQLQGSKGQHVADNRTWIVKSHHPLWSNGYIKFDSKKVVTIVRNPLDFIASYATLI